MKNKTSKEIEQNSEIEVGVFLTAREWGYVFDHIREWEFLRLKLWNALIHENVVKNKSPRP